MLVRVLASRSKMSVCLSTSTVPVAASASKATGQKRPRRTESRNAAQMLRTAEKSDTHVGKLLEAVDKILKVDGNGWFAYYMDELIVSAISKGQQPVGTHALNHALNFRLAATDPLNWLVALVPKARDALKEVLILNRQPPAAADALVRLMEDLAEREARVLGKGKAVNTLVGDMFFSAANDFSLDHRETMAKFESLIAARTTNLTEKARKRLQELPHINDNARQLKIGRASCRER